MSYSEEQEIEDAKINFSTIQKISNIVFLQKASEVLNIPVERVEVRRCIVMGNGYGKLTEYVYKEDDKKKEYYQLSNGSKQYFNLSPNIFEFEKELKHLI